MSEHCARCDREIKRDHSGRWVTVYGAACGGGVFGNGRVTEHLPKNVA
jgi:hypothetical protein